MSDQRIPDRDSEMLPDQTDSNAKQQPSDRQERRGARQRRVAVVEMVVRHEWPPTAKLTDEQVRMREQGQRMLARIIADGLLAHEEPIDATVAQGTENAVSSTGDNSGAALGRSSEGEAA